MRKAKLVTLALLVALASGGGAQAQIGVLGVPVDSAGSGAEGALASSGSARASGPLRLEVRLAERRLYVYQGDSALASYPVAVGKPQHPTPQGEFGIRRVIWNPRWIPPKVKWAKGKTSKGPGDPDNPMGRVKMFFQEPDYYIHGTNDEESLGQATSHGCIRMANEHIVELARLVMEHGGQPREPNWFQRILNRARRTQEVRLMEPVAVIVRG